MRASLGCLSWLCALHASAALSVNLSLTMPENATVFPRLWRTNVKPSNNGLPSFWPADSPLVAALPRWTPPAGANETLLFTERVTLVRLLGGWSDGGGDFVANATADGGYDADWSALDARVDPIVARGLSPLVVFDNVPWAFAPNASEGDYGNVYGPDDELYGAFEAFARALVARLAARHGAEAAAGWQWRVGTEPNCECHWLDTTRAYLRYYEVCSRAVKDALPRARVGPGNFPKGMRMDMVADINAWLAANATHPPDVLGVSYYGDDANGYRPWEMAESARWMRAYIDALPGPRAELHFMEYGTLNNALRRASNEPGAFGAAFTAAGLVVALRERIAETYHWTDADELASGPLLFGWAWLFAVAELLVGCAAAPLASSAPATASWNATSVTGLAAFDDGTVFAAEPTLYLLVTPFNPQRYNDTDAGAARVTVRVKRDVLRARLGFVPAAADELTVAQWAHDARSSWYDQIWRDLRARGAGLKDPADNYVYQLGHMTDDDGAAFVDAHYEQYNEMQLDALAPAPFDGIVADEGDTVTFTFDAACPSVHVLSVTRSSHG